MAQRRRIVFPFPTKGLDEYWAYREQQPFTSPSLQNVRALEPIGDRARGGARPGLSKVFSEQVGSASQPIRLLGQVHRFVTEDTFESITDDFNRANSLVLGKDWSTMPGAAGSLQIKLNALVTAPVHATNYYANVFRSTTFSQYTPYSLSIDVMLEGEYAAGIVQIYACMDDETPDPSQQALIVYLACIGPSADLTRIGINGIDVLQHPPYYVYGGAASVSVGGRLVATYALTGIERATNAAQTLTLSIARRNISATLAGDTLLSDTAIAPLVGGRCGLGLNTTSAIDPIYLDNWTITNARVGGEARDKATYLLVGGNGELWTDSGGATLTKVTGTYAGIGTSVNLMAAQARGRLFIAEYGDPLKESTNGVISGTGNKTLDDSGVSDWTSLGIDATAHVVEIATKDGTNPYVATCRIASVSAGSVTLADGFPYAGKVRYSIQRAPKYYNPADNAVYLYLPERGDSIPLGCPIICTYRGRIVLAGHRKDPQNFYQSRAHDPFDFDFSQTDALAAVAGHTGHAGRIGDVITALIPFGDDFLLYGGRHSLHLQRGDIAAGGFIETVAEHIGVLDRFAWCYEPGGGVFFLGVDGLYWIAPGLRPKAISHTRLPSTLSNIDLATYEPLLAYDHERQAVMIFVTRKATGASTHYVYDVRNDAFFKDVLPDAHGPTVVLNYDSDAAARRTLLLGGRDGYVRKYDDTVADDDGEAIHSRVVFCPQRLAADDGYEGTLNELVAALGADTTNVQYELRTNTTHEAVVSAAARSITGTWTTGGLQTPIRARIRGGSIALILSNDTVGKRWAVERIVGTAVTAGRVRA